MWPEAVNASRPPPAAAGLAGGVVEAGAAAVDELLLGTGAGDAPPAGVDVLPAQDTATAAADTMPARWRSLMRRTLAAAVFGSRHVRAGGEAVRLFAAVDPPVEVRRQLLNALPSREDGLRYVPAEQWHLTLAFYGEVDEDRLPALRSGLERAAGRSRPVRLRLAGAGSFPRRPAKARVVWVGVDGEVDELRRLADRCAGAGRRARIAMEARSFRAHLTLARARVGAVDATATVEALASFASDWWTVDVVRLVHSTLGAQVRHEAVAELRLGGPQDRGRGGDGDRG